VQRTASLRSAAADAHRWAASALNRRKTMFRSRSERNNINKGRLYLSLILLCLSLVAYVLYTRIRAAQTTVQDQDRVTGVFVALVLRPAACDTGLGGFASIHLSQTTSEPLILYHLLRFYPDGFVLSEYTCIRRSVQENWPNISQWFYRDSPDVKFFGYYKLVDNQIVFNVTNKSANVEFDYDGVYLSNKMILNEHLPASIETREYMKLEIGQN
jgi:hypothetical protein